MPKAIVTEELVYSTRTTDKFGNDYTKILADLGYEKYVIDFDPKICITKWDVPKIVDAVTKCDAVFFNQRVDKDASIVKVIHATAKCLGKQRLYWNMLVPDYEDLQRNFEWCEARMERIKDDLELLHVTTGTDIHNNIAALRKQLADFAWQVFTKVPRDADAYEVDCEVTRVDDLEEGGCILDCRHGGHWFRDCKHDQKNLELVLAKYQNNIR